MSSPPQSQLKWRIAAYIAQAAFMGCGQSRLNLEIVNPSANESQVRPTANSFASMSREGEVSIKPQRLRALFPWVKLRRFMCNRGEHFFIPAGTFFCPAPLIYEPAWIDRNIMRTTYVFGRMALWLAIAALTFHGNNSGAQNSYFQRNLVSDIAGMAEKTDTNLVNPWGIAASGTSPFWVADNHAGVSTLYDGNGIASSL